MLDKLKAISPVLIVVLLLSQCYLAWAASEARKQARVASFQAMQASNAANRAYASSHNASAQLRALHTVVSSISASRARGGSDRMLRVLYSHLTYSTAYHEFLLEDLARHSKLDLKAIRRDFERLAAKMGHAKPKGWTWARKVD